MARAKEYTMPNATSNTSSPRYAVRLLDAGPFWLDGGSMFGLIPSVVWKKTLETDDLNRIKLGHNCLLLEGPPAEGETKNRLVVIETGSGNKLPSKMKSIFLLSDRWLGTALEDAGCNPDDVTDVIVSHLHFDHAGGLTRLCEEGETPDWSGEDGGGGGEAGVKLTMPNAKLHVQTREWSDALANRSVMNKTYYPDHLMPYAARPDLLTLHDSPRPFPTGSIPDRDALPKTTVAMRETEVAPGISVFLTPGHTWGQQAVKFTETSGQTIVFVPDVLPTAWHAGAAYSLAYDVEPYTSMMSKRWLLHEAAKNDWTLCLDHHPENPFFKVIPNERGWFTLEQASLPNA